MSKLISGEIKELVKKSHYDYEGLGAVLGLSSKQAVSYILNHREDDDWKYEDIKRWCGVLNYSWEVLLADVDRKKAYLAKNS